VVDSRKKKLYWWIGGCAIALVVFGNQGFRKLISIWAEQRRLEKTLVTLRSDNERLARELHWIQSDPAYNEYLIRKNLGYVKKGEVEYRIIKSDKKE
jgi:cell division protein FtsB